MEHFVFEDNDHSLKLEGRFWNCQGKHIGIIAFITKKIDWAAYIGADESFTEISTLRYTAQYGSKLSEEDARYFFPDIELPYRR